MFYFILIQFKCSLSFTRLSPIFSIQLTIQYTLELYRTFYRAHYSVLFQFGLCNAGATFQRTMEMLLKGVDSSTAYIDDVLIHSKTFEEHMKHLRRLLVKLKESGVKVKTTKCKIACKETMFLGYKISD